MPTKTISLELDAYDKLKRAKRDSRESFSSVVRRAIIPESVHTGKDLLPAIEERRSNGRLMNARALQRLDEVQRRPSSSTSRWRDKKRD